MEILKNSALLVIGMQNDFMSFGNMEKIGSDEMIPMFNSLMPKFTAVFAIKISYPPNHFIFAANHLFRQPGKIMKINGKEHVLKPMYCISGSFGSEFPKLFNSDALTDILFIGKNPEVDIESGFKDENGDDTGLDLILKKYKIEKIYVSGTDSDLILNTVRDALTKAYNVYLVDNLSFVGKEDKENLISIGCKIISI